MSALYGLGTNIPKAPVAPTFIPAQVDSSRINFLTQQAAAPGLRGLRVGLSESLNQRFDNPNVQALVARSALSGFGTGVSNVLGQASRTGNAQFGREFASQNQADLINFNSTNARQNADYQNELDQYLLKQRLDTQQAGLTQNAYDNARTRLDSFGDNVHTGKFSTGTRGSNSNIGSPMSSYPQFNSVGGAPTGDGVGGVPEIGPSLYYDNRTKQFINSDTGQPVVN